MKHITWIVLACVAMLTACQEDMSPLVSGTVYFQQGKTLAERQLTPDQLNSLTAWLMKSRSGWGRCYLTPPGSIFSVALKHADGNQSKLFLLNFANSQTTLEAVYLSGSNLSDQPCAIQSFSQDELNDLRSILGIANPNGFSFADESQMPEVNVSGDKRALMVKRAANSAPVVVPVIDRCGTPLIGEPGIRDVRMETGKVVVTYGKHCGATVSLQDLRLTCGGCD